MAQETEQSIDIASLRPEWWASLPAGIAPESIDAQILIDCIKDAVAIDPALFFEEGLDVNWRDVETGLTLLHLAAGYGDRELLRHLLKHPDTDYLIEDREGRFPSTLAFAVAKDGAVGRLLVKKQGDQAREMSLVAYGPNAGLIRIDDDSEES